MSNSGTSNIELNQLLTAVVNLLHRHIVDANRTQAKSIFNNLESKRVVGLVRLKMADGNTLDTELEMDSTDFVGDLKFGVFRNALTSWMANAIDQLKSEQGLQMLNSEVRDEMLFKIPGPVVHEGQLNVMFLSMFQPVPGRLRIRLIFVDPSQFTQEQSGEEATA
jgi:hypothetical protein